MLVSIKCSLYLSDYTHLVSSLDHSYQGRECPSEEFSNPALFDSSIPIPLCKGAWNYAMYSAHKYETKTSIPMSSHFILSLLELIVVTVLPVVLMFIWEITISHCCGVVSTMWDYLLQVQLKLKMVLVMNKPSLLVCWLVIDSVSGECEHLFS